MTNATAAVLEPVGEARVALESVDVQASLQGLYEEVVVSQVYRNLETINIEAVYTFPLPMDAVLLDLSLELNGKLLKGEVQRKSEAEESYEVAMDDGDTAVLLQQLEPGLYTMNVGNILPGEQAVLRFRYAQLHRWQGDSLRLHLPLTIAPRYGDPSASGLAPHEVPEHALSVDHGFTLRVRIEGALAQAELDCPSHPIVVSTRDGITELSLSGGSTQVDRDFILLLKEPAESMIEAIAAPDGDEHVVLASFHPVFPDDMPESPRCVKLVVDCSGSMGGDSIAQAKKALHDIVSLLKPDDYFNLIAFGSSFDMLFPEPVIANDKNVRKAAGFVEQIDANMGGTEIGAALNAAYGCGKIDKLPSDVLLITDGEVWDHERIVEDARHSGHRIFTVGVGSAVSEAFVRGIAEATNGACELVSPRENMSQRIVRHFQRIDQQCAQSIHIEWPVNPLRQIPATVETVYAGDTLHVLGWLEQPQVGQVRLTMTFEDGRTVTQAVQLSEEPAYDEALHSSLPRVAARMRMSSLDSVDAAELAERYQLVTEHTSCVLVCERDDEQKAQDIPALRKVPQLLAAGWGGAGCVESRLFCSSPMVQACRSVDFLSIPSFLRRQNIVTFDVLISKLNERYPDSASAQLDINTIDELVELGLDQAIADELSDLVEETALVSDKCIEAKVVVLFLSVLAKHKHGKGCSRHVKRLMRQASKQFALPASVVERVVDLV